jgi:hypothetical protein
MLIKKSIETPKGTVQFEGELSQKELDAVLQIGLSVIFMRGGGFYSPEPAPEGASLQ